MIFSSTEIGGLILINTPKFIDDRGVFVKVFNQEVYEKNGLATNFKECFYSHSRKGVLRGMHFQLPPDDNEKLVYVLAGVIMDVVLDLRLHSESYGGSYSRELSSENGLALYLPKGVAHGFLALSDATVVYMTTTGYSESSDSGVHWNSFGFDWGIAQPTVSKRDSSLPPIDLVNSPF